MKTLSQLAPSLWCAPLLLFVGPLADTVAFHPADGTSISKESEVHVTFELGDITAEVDGQDMSDNIPGDFDGALDIAMSWTDKYVAVDKEKQRPTDLIRTYDSLSGEYDVSAAGESESGDIKEIDALVDHSVRFKWNAEKSAYDISFHECSGDEKLLASQTDDLDLRAILPDKAVSEGDTWEVDGSKLGSMLFGKLDAAQIPDDNPMADVIRNEVLPQIEKLAKTFKVHCEYKGQREDGSSKLGVIAMRLEGGGTIDLANAIQSAIEAQAPEGVEFDLDIRSAALDTKLEGKGECLWNLAAGHVHAASSDVEFSATFDFDASVDVQNEQHSMKANVELPGKIAWKLAVK
jgi:hypothetical protein